ncbi:MAG: T9SS type A sorting domain-containing protein [Chitinophagales bacterium]|nr:T9SS type A sorting domain-containing protein [Chitinophagales bacterium]
MEMLLVVGTGSKDVKIYEDFYEYDPSTDSWETRPNFPGGKRYSAMAFSIGNKGYVGSGSDALMWYQDFWEYDPLTYTWTQKANLTGVAREQAVAFSIGGKGYIGTGWNNLYGILKDFWEYDPTIDMWYQKSDFGGGKRYGAIAFSIDSVAYAGLGYDSTNYLAGKDIWKYSPDDFPTLTAENFSQSSGFSIFPVPIIWSATISFSVQQPAEILIELLDLKGNIIKMFFDEEAQTGQRLISFNRDNIPSGIYFLRMQCNHQTTLKKIIIQ